MKKRAPLRLPKKLAFTVVRLAALGTFACSSSEAPRTTPTDAAADGPAADDATSGDAPADKTNADVVDATMDTVTMQDAPMEADGPVDSPPDCNFDESFVFCGPSGLVDGAVCPGPVCSIADCPLDAGCEPLA